MLDDLSKDKLGLLQLEHDTLSDALEWATNSKSQAPNEALYYIMGVHDAFINIIAALSSSN